MGIPRVLGERHQLASWRTICNGADVLYGRLLAALGWTLRMSPPSSDNERQFQLLVDSIKDYAIFMLDPDGRVTSWNSGAQRIKGYRPDEIIGRDFTQFYTDEDRAAGVPAQLLARAAAIRPGRGGGFTRPQGRQPVLGERDP